jgi:formylglycine-generating enzyme required for sulfatase activity
VAEYWIATRPRGAPEPTAEIRTFIFASRQAADAAQRRRRLARASIYTLLAGIILGLVGWINQEYLKQQWHWYTAVRPYAKAQVWPHVLTAAQERALTPRDSFKECAQDCPEMIVAPAGSFTMGSLPTDKDRSQSEPPPHRVTISRPFAVSKFALTFADWDACVLGGGCNGYKPNDFGFGRGRQPVIAVTWDDAQQYVRWLAAVTGKPYRLLSETEYEYATRAGTSTAYPWGDDIKVNGTAMANCNACGSKWDGRETAPVGSFAPNAFGLYDMVGNVLEWVEDCAHESFEGAPIDGSAWVTDGDCSRHVARGGCYAFPPSSIRSAYRLRTPSAVRFNALGLRVGRTLLAP